MSAYAGRSKELNASGAPVAYEFLSPLRYIFSLS